MSGAQLPSTSLDPSQGPGVREHPGDRAGRSGGARRGRCGGGVAGPGPCRLEETKAALPTDPSRNHRVLLADLADPTGVRSAVVEWLGSAAPVHILVNNAGGPAPGPILRATEDELRAAFAMHVLSSQALVQALVPGMEAAGYGRIINVISTSVREPIRGLGVSNTIRAAMAGWAKTLSREVAPLGITVNNILPGSTRTDRLNSIIASRAKAANTDGRGDRTGNAGRHSGRRASPTPPSPLPPSRFSPPPRRGISPA